MSKQEFKQLSYRKQLSFLMQKAREKLDIYALLVIQDKINQHDKERASKC